MGMFHYSGNIAKECNSIICAILFHHILYWVEKNKKLEKMKKKNHTWVYQSYSQFEKRFNHMSRRQIIYNLDKLEEKDLIISTDKFSNSEEAGIFKTTKWYTVTERGYEILGNDLEYVTKQINGNYNKKIITTNLRWR